jgi:WD40 repeat protein
MKLLLTADVSPDGAFLATGGEDVRVFDFATGRRLHVLPAPRRVCAVKFSPVEADLIASGGDDGLVRLWRIGEDAPVRVLAGQTTTVLDISFSPDGRLIAAGGTRYDQGEVAAGEFRIWNVETGEEQHAVAFEDHDVRGVAFSTDGSLVAFAKNEKDRDGSSTIEVYDIERWERRHRIPFEPGFASSIAFQPDGRRLIICGGECIPVPDSAGCRTTGRMWLADLDVEQPATQLELPELGYFYSVAFTSRGDRFATGTAVLRIEVDRFGQPRGSSWIGQIQMRRAKDGSVIWSSDGEYGSPIDTTISTDGNLIICCSGQQVLVFDAKSGERQRAIEVYEDPYLN